ncbi:MAG: hypothetical protein SGPRY_004910, partial [Prymnesium sp.]
LPSVQSTGRPRAPPPLSILQSPFPSPELPESEGVKDVLPTNFQSSAWPVRTMIFIDGTWLYYSLYEGRPGCPLRKKFGSDWKYSHRVAFEQLPAMIAKSVHQQLLDYSQVQRFVEVVRTVVFTSARADTHAKSYRMRMFQRMEEANFEVHMSTTVGLQEKCVDIALAVEMMHYASVEGAYDCAVLVTGDKDFMPALSRIRQKGKQVAICSMRNCCSRELLLPSSRVRDFDPVWIEDHLDEFVFPNLRSSGVDNFTVSALMELIVNYLQAQPENTASSRDLGRFLQTQPGASPRSNALETLKEGHFSLRNFLTDHQAWFNVSDSSEFRLEFEVVLLDSDFAAEEHRVMDAKLGISASDESEGEDEQPSGAGKWGEQDGMGEGWEGGSEMTQGVLQRRTVPELRDELRVRGLLQSGRKDVLIQRLLHHSSSGERTGRGAQANGSTRREERELSAEECDEQLRDSVAKFLEASGGSESSRNIGRHLSALGLLRQLKSRHSGLFHFLQQNNEAFRIELPNQDDSLEYYVHLRAYEGRLAKSGMPIE